MKNVNVMGFRGYRFFSPKSSKAKYKTLGTSEANFGGKKPRIILREVRYPFYPLLSGALDQVERDCKSSVGDLAK